MKRQFNIIWVLFILTSCSHKECPVIDLNSVGIKLHNKSGVTMTSLTLLHEKGELKRSNLIDNSTTCLSFISPSENEFTLTITLDNGKTLRTTQYSEGGYDFDVLVLKDTIKTTLFDSY